ncbi:hypothetical protein HDU83_003355 [Entophlyctis luteolus]|nr:hypothetical protein HDU83_003355 [Entophlyctis luteolus]
MNQDIWYLLVDQNGEPAFEDIDTDKVRVSTEGDLADFRTAVWEKNRDDLRMSAARLKVFSNKDALLNKDGPLESDASVNGLGETKKTPLFVVVPKKRVRSEDLDSDSIPQNIAGLLSKSLSPIKKRFNKPSSRVTPRSHPKTPSDVKRWVEFKQAAANYVYPNAPISKDIVLPATTEIEFNSEKDVDKVIGSHLDNFNRIFRDLNQRCRFRTKAVFSSQTSSSLDIDDTNSNEAQIKFIGQPDNVLVIDQTVVSFVENKTPNDLPVRHLETQELFDLLFMYLEDRNYKKSKIVRGNIGRTDICSLIEQVYGYLALNNLIYGCVTCYDVTYFLWQSERGLLHISHPIYNDGLSPTLLQSFYYFAHLVLEGNTNGQQGLDPSPTTDCLMEKDNSDDSGDEKFSDKELSQNISESGSNYSSGGSTKRTKYSVSIDRILHGKFIGAGATGQVIHLRGLEVVLKHCDSHNNPEGYNMLMNEIAIYEYLSNLNLKFIPQYYGVCEFFGQYFLALDFIEGKHCDWSGNTALKNQLSEILGQLESVGVFYHDLCPGNVLVTPSGDVKLIDFGKARMVEKVQ